MRPVPPGWVAVPVQQETPNEWYHIIGWTDSGSPVIAWKTGVAEWSTHFGTDAYCVATLEEWTGSKC